MNFKVNNKQFALFATIREGNHDASKPFWFLGNICLFGTFSIVSQKTL